MKNHRKTNLYPDTSGKSQFITTVLCIMLLTPLLFLGEGLGVRCLAQVANGTGAGNCLSFNGTTNYIQYPNNANRFNFGAGNFTLEASVKCNVTGNSQVVLYTGYKGLEIYGVLITPAGKVLFWFRDAADNAVSVTSPNVIADGTWHHITGFRNGTTGYLYVDGVLVNQNTNAAIGAINTNCTILWTGAYNSTSFACPTNAIESYFLGQIDEVRIWNTARTETEIRDNMCKKLTGSESGLVGYWRFDEGSGSTAYDSSPNGNNGTLH